MKAGGGSPPLHREGRCRVDGDGTNTVQGCKVTIAGLPVLVDPSHGGCAAHAETSGHVTSRRRCTPERPTRGRVMGSCACKAGPLEGLGARVLVGWRARGLLGSRARGLSRRPAEAASVDPATRRTEHGHALTDPLVGAARLGPAVLGLRWYGAPCGPAERSGDRSFVGRERPLGRGSSDGGPRWGPR